MKVKVVTNILEANDRIAAENKKIFEEAHVYVINIMSGPGAGKTSLLERTIRQFDGKIKIGVIEGEVFYGCRQGVGRVAGAEHDCVQRPNR